MKPATSLLLVAFLAVGCSGSDNAVTRPPLQFAQGGGTAEEEVFGYLNGVSSQDYYSVLLTPLDTNQPDYFVGEQEVVLSLSRPHWGWYAIDYGSSGYDGPCLSNTTASANGNEVHGSDPGGKEVHCINNGRFRYQLFRNGDLVDEREIDWLAHPAQGLVRVNTQPASPSTVDGSEEDNIVIYDGRESISFAEVSPLIDFAYGPSATGPWTTVDLTATHILPPGSWVRVETWRTQSTYTVPYPGTSRQVLQARIYFSFVEATGTQPQGFMWTGTEGTKLARARRLAPHDCTAIQVHFVQPLTPPIVRVFLVGTAPSDCEIL